MYVLMYQCICSALFQAIKKGISYTTDSSFQSIDCQRPSGTNDYDNAALACSTTAANPALSCTAISARTLRSKEISAFFNPLINRE